MCNCMCKKLDKMWDDIKEIKSKLGQGCDCDCDFKYEQSAEIDATAEGTIIQGA